MWQGSFNANKGDHSGVVKNSWGEVVIDGLTFEQTFRITRLHNTDLEAIQMAMYRAVLGVPLDPQKIAGQLITPPAPPQPQQEEAHNGQG